MGKRSKYELVVSLMCSSGFMLLICGVPGMVLAIFCEYLTERMMWNEAVISMGVLTGLIIPTGGMLLWLGLYLAKRIQRSKAEKISAHS